MPLSPQGCCDGDQPYDARPVPQVVQPRGADPILIQLQKQRVMVSKALLRASIVVAVKTSLLPERGTADGMVGLPVDGVGDRPPRGGPSSKLVQGRPLLHGSLGRRSRPGERSRPSGEGRHEHLRGRWSVAERGVRAHAVVVSSPTLDHDLRLLERVEDLTVQKLVP